MPPIDFTAIPLDELRPSVSDPRPSLPLEPPEPDACSTFKGPGFVRLSEDGRFSFDRVCPPGASGGVGASSSRTLSTTEQATLRAEIQGRLRRAVKRGVVHPMRLRMVATKVAVELEEAGHGVEDLGSLLSFIRDISVFFRGPEDITDDHLPFWIPGDIAAWLAPEAEGIVDCSWAERPLTGRVHHTGGGASAPFEFHRTYEVPCIFFISPQGDDTHEGTYDRPFKTFWPIRMWFALIEWLSFYRRGWDFSEYHPTIYLREGAWTFPGEYQFGYNWTYNVNGFRGKHGAYPPFEAIYSKIDIPDGYDRFTAFSLAWKYLIGQPTRVVTAKEPVDGSEWSAYYGRELLALNNCFLKIPRGLTGVLISAYENEQVSISGGYTKYTDDGSYLYPLNPELSRIIGVLSIPEVRALDTRVTYDSYVASLVGVQLHENEDVLIKGVEFQGFRTAIFFLGACQSAHVRGCAFENLTSWGVKAGMVEYLDYLLWQTDDAEKRVCLAFWPTLFLEVPCDLRIRGNTFLHVGQGGDSSAVNLGTAASNVEILENEFAECVDGVMVDTGPGSGLHIHHNRFFCCREARPDNGDGNGIDLKTIRPRTAETLEELEPGEGEELPPERWTRIHDNWFMGNLSALIMHKGVGWIQIYNNHFIDNYTAICISVKGVSVMPISEIASARLDLYRYPVAAGTILDDAAWSAIISDALAAGQSHRFSFVDPFGIYDATPSCPFDEWETDSEGRRYFTIEEVRIFRNVIASSWSHGLHMLVGAQTLACEKDLDGSGATPYALTIRNVVIAQNTLVGNGGAWLKQFVPAGRVLAGAHSVEGVFPSGGYGILLARSRAPAVDDGAVAELTYACLLGDRFEKVAIYNNILADNFSYQIFVMDSSLHRRIFDSIHFGASDYNVVPRPRRGTPEGIAEYNFIAIDYNAYYYEGIGDAKTGGYRHFVVTDVYGGLPEGWNYPVDTILTTFANEDEYLKGDAGSRYRFAVESYRDGLFDEDLAFDLNRLMVTSYDQLFDTTAYGNIHGATQAFTLARNLRRNLNDEELLDYYRNWCDESWQPWRTRGDSSVREYGANGSAKFPDETQQCETGEPVYQSPDIEGQPVENDPDIGAYEIG